MVAARRVTHTEKAHLLFGVGLALIGGCALCAAWWPASGARLVWPVLAFLLGAVLFVPVETQGRTYDAMGWWDVLWSFIPDTPSRWLPDWIAMTGKRHVWQHKVGAFLAMAAGVIEFMRARGKLSAGAWGFVLPALTVAIGLAFGIHGGNPAHLSHRVEQFHHQVLGLSFVVAGASLALVQAGRLHGPWWRGLWAMLVLVVGVDVALFYRLSPQERRQEVHQHESPGSR